MFTRHIKLGNIRELGAGNQSLFCLLFPKQIVSEGAIGDETFMGMGSTFIREVATNEETFLYLFKGNS